MASSTNKPPHYRPTLAAIQEQRRRLESSTDPPRISQPQTKSLSSDNRISYISLPHQFSWKSYPGIAQPSSQTSWSTCITESILTVIADLFWLAGILDEPVEFSSQYLLSNYPQYIFTLNILF